MDDKGLGLTQKFAQLVIDTAVQSQGPTLLRQMSGELAAATREQLAQLLNVVATLRRDTALSAQALQKDIRNSAAAQGEIGLAVQVLQHDMDRTALAMQTLEAQSATAHQLLQSAAENSWAAASDVQKLRQEVGQAIDAMGSSPQVRAEDRSSALLSLEQSIWELRALLLERIDRAPASPVNPPQATIRESTQEANHGSSWRTVLDSGWVRSIFKMHQLAAGIVVGALTAALVLQVDRLFSPRGTSPAPVAAHAPSAAGSDSKASSPATGLVTEPVPAPRPPDPKPANPLPATGATEDAYVSGLVSELLRATVQDQTSRQQVAQVFKDAGISLPTDAAGPPALAMHHLESISSTKRTPALAGFLLQAILLKESQGPVKVDGKVGPATTEMLSKTPCIAKSAGLKRQNDLLLNPKEQWIAIIKACAAR